MATVNPLARELVFKVVFYGPGLGGKTTTLQHLYATAKPEHRGKMVSLATPVDRTLYFDFLPIRLPRVRGMGVRLQLFTVPGQVYYNATRKLVLTGADGIVFVADSQAARMDANLESLQNLRENLREQGRELSRVPHVVQHNKRDLADALPLDELDRMLNAHRAPSFGTSAARGEGVYETLEAIARVVLDDFERNAPPEQKGLAPRLGEAEGGLSEALRNADAELEAPPSETIVAGLSHAGPAAGVSIAPDAGAEAPGEIAARAVVGGGAASNAFSLAELWPESERELVRQAEAAIAARRWGRAVELADALVARVLAGAAGAFGTTDAPRDPALVPLLLGIDGRRYLAFRGLVREVRGGAEVEGREALEAVVFAAEVRVARGHG